jgi:hypothetical protein
MNFETLRSRGEQLQEVVNSLFDPFKHTSKSDDANKKHVTLSEKNYLRIKFIKDLMNVCAGKHLKVEESQQGLQADDHRYGRFGLLFSYAQQAITKPFREEEKTKPAMKAISHLLDACEASLKLVVNEGEFNELLDDSQYDFMSYRKAVQSNEPQEFEENPDDERIERIQTDNHYSLDEKNELWQLIDSELTSYASTTGDDKLLKRFHSLFDYREFSEQASEVQQTRKSIN